MVGLLDIARVTRRVPVQGQEIEVSGISAGSVAYLLDKFPTVKTLVAGGKITDAKEMIRTAPDAVAAVIAAATGGGGDPAVEAAAAALPLENQLDLLEAIVAITMPNGFVPFVNRLTALLGGGIPESARSSERRPKPNGDASEATPPT